MPFRCQIAATYILFRPCLSAKSLVFDDDRRSNHRQIECLEAAYRGRSVARAWGVTVNCLTLTVTTLQASLEFRRRIALPRILACDRIQKWWCTCQPRKTSRALFACAFSQTLAWRLFLKRGLAFVFAVILALIAVNVTALFISVSVKRAWSIMVWR